MKCIFQLIDGETGERSPALAHDRKAFAEVVRDLLDKGTVRPGDFVLVVVEHPDSSDAVVSRAPLMLAHNFVQAVLVDEVKPLSEVEPVSISDIRDALEVSND